MQVYKAARSIGMELKEVKTEYRMQEMQKAIQARTESGLTISEWCQKNNISKGSYYYWLRKIRNRVVEKINSKNEIIEVPIIQQNSSDRNMMPIKIKYKEMEVEIPCGIKTEDIIAILRAVKSC